MLYGRRYQTAGVIPNPEFGKYFPDGRMNPGSLLMLDISHPDVDISGVPTSGQSIPNIAAENCATLIGSSSSTAMSWNNNFTTGEAQFSRTPKGGLYGVVSRSAQGGHFAGFSISTALSAYLHAAEQASKAFALFIWTEVNRVAINAADLKEVGIGNYGATNFATDNLFDAALANILGKQRFSQQRTWMGARAPGTPSNQARDLFYFGNTNGYNSFNANDGRSLALYMVHLVEVAASGMTYSALNAADAKNYDEYFGTGGLFAGDTLPDPNSLIPS